MILKARNTRAFLLLFAAQKIFDLCSTYVLPARATSTPVLVCQLLRNVEVLALCAAKAL